MSKNFRDGTLVKTSNKKNSPVIKLWRTSRESYTSKDKKQLETSAPQYEIRLGKVLILLNLLDVIMILVIIFFPSNVFRNILAIPFLLFFPGYMILMTIFTRKGEIGGIERVVLSFGLSVVVVSLIGLILNYTPWGIRLEPILYSVVSFIFIASIIAWSRQRRLKEDDRFCIKLHLKFLSWGKSLTDRVLTITLVLAILGTLCILIYFMEIPKQGETFTEFYILGQQGNSADYPVKLKLGDEGKVIIGIINHERMEVNYSVKVVISGNTTAVIEPLVLADQQKWEGEVSFIANVLGENQKVEFVLFKNGEAGPYRELHLWIDVTE